MYNKQMQKVEERMCFLKEEKKKGGGGKSYRSCFKGKIFQEEHRGRGKKDWGKKKSESNSQTRKQGKYTVKQDSDEAKLGGVFNVIEQRNYAVAPTVISSRARK